MHSIRRGIGPLFVFFAVGFLFADAGVKLRPMAPISVDANGARMQKPEGVGCNRDRVVVADTGNGRLLPYTLSQDVISAGEAITLPELPYPTHVAVNSKGEILAVDRKLRRVARLSPSGEFLGYLELGPDDSRVNAVPWSVKVDREDRIYVLDTYRGRVLVLNPDGSAQREIALPERHGFVADIAADSLGVVYAIDSTEKVLLHAEKGQDRFVPLTERLHEEMDFPTSVAAGAGEIFVADRNGGGIVVFGRDGSYRGRQSSMGWKEGYLRYPSALCLDEQGDLFVADRENNRVQAFFVIK